MEKLLNAHARLGCSKYRVKNKFVFKDQGAQTRKSGTDFAGAGRLPDTGQKQQGRINIPRY
jgi:hypothetical protein